MGLRAEVYRSSRIGDCSNGGLSGWADTVTIVNAEGPFEPTDDAPAVLVQNGPLGTVNATPAVRAGDATGDGREEGWVAERVSGSVGPMMGGAYIATSDSRFSELVERLLGSRFYGALPLHDRFETTAQYASYD